MFHLGYYWWFRLIQYITPIGLLTRVSKLLNNFNTIQECLVEVASTTFADIIEEILIVVICIP